jgi:hypothetical protein
MVHLVGDNLPDKHELPAVRAFDTTRQSEFVGILVYELSSIKGNK